MLLLSIELRTYYQARFLEKSRLAKFSHKSHINDVKITIWLQNLHITSEVDHGVTITNKQGYQVLGKATYHFYQSDTPPLTFFCVTTCGARLKK